jgi:hypothetical protein
MFQMKPAAPLVWNADSKAMVDEDRDASLQRIGNTGMDPGFVLVLTWGGRVIPFAISFQPHKATEERPEYTIFRFTDFGATNRAFWEGIEGYRFRDEAEREAAQLLAVEALLAWGGNYRGAEYPDGRIRVEYQGRTWILSDFGMA